MSQILPAIVQISATGDSSTIITTDGRAYATGTAVVSTSKLSTFKRLISKEPLEMVVQLPKVMIAIGRNSKLYHYGASPNPNMITFPPISFPDFEPPESDPIEIVANQSQLMILSSGGDVYVTGTNDFNQLGSLNGKGGSFVLMKDVPGVEFVAMSISSRLLQSR